MLWSKCHNLHLHAAENSNNEHDKIILTTLGWYVEETINNSLLGVYVYIKERNDMKNKTWKEILSERICVCYIE